MISDKTQSDIPWKRARLIITVLLLSVPMTCKSVKWKPMLHPAERIPYIFDDANFIGTGLKYSGSGFLPKTCLSNVRSITRGGELSFEFRHIESDYTGPHGKTDYFLRESLKKSAEFNLQKKKPVSFLVIVNLNNRHSVISEEEAEFLPFVNEMIKAGDLNRFFETCGTEYVYSTRFNSRIRLFVTYYIAPGREEKIVKEVLRKRISAVPGNSLQAGIFKDLSFTRETYFSLEVGTDYFFNPVEFPFKKKHGEDVSGFLNRAIHSILNAGKGGLTGYETMPWKQFGPLKKFGVDRSFIKLSESSDESVFKSLKALETSVRNFNLTYYQIKKTAEKVREKRERIYLYDCLNELIEAKNWINWNQYYSCYGKAREERSLSLREIPQCSVMIDFSRMIEKSSRCNNLPVSADEELPQMWKEAHRPVQLTRYLVADPESLEREYTGYRYSDKEQVENLPDRVKLGQQMDMTGKVYPGKCINEKTIKPVESHSSRDYRITSRYYPRERVTRPLWKRILLFWKKPEPERLRYRGFLEIEGYSRKLAPGFTLTKNAEKLAKKNLNEFYARCGTHYVSQVKHRRGFVYKFSFNRKDDDIEIETYGLPDKKKRDDALKMEAMTEKLPEPPGGMNRGCGCLYGLFPSFSGKEIPGSENLLEPETLGKFFKNKRRIIELFRSDGKAVPVRLALEPWSEYFQSHNLLPPDRIDALYYKTGKRFEVATYIDKGGIVYTGEVKGRVAHGEGTIIYPDKRIYSGRFKNGRRVGMGTQRWPNGDSFTGEWKNGKREGFGIYRWRNGDVYEGLFTEDNRQGNGTLYWRNGDQYRGEWKNNKREGAGVYIWSDGDRYEGEFINDRISGKGKFIKRDEEIR